MTVVPVRSRCSQLKNFIRTLTIGGLVTYMKESSLLVFHQDWAIRHSFTAILSSQYWDKFTLFLIFGNGIMLAIDSPLNDQSNDSAQKTRYINTIFTIVFLIEMFMKLVSLGFVFNHRNNSNAYIRSYWNIVDFIVIMPGAIVLFTNDNSVMQGFQAIKSFRALRPLKVINKNEQLKIIVMTLNQIVP